ncbi:hypothetical protein [Pyxidicoccus trucidator]|uniref:hypothetical protein n=1 Tax=Pyxidicoccus trucidator TaxID=2709662 RepID=UPI0013DAC840|nr:hypothetical protein [Pyxidicoccus trucidator]
MNLKLQRKLTVTTPPSFPRAEPKPAKPPPAAAARQTERSSFERSAPRPAGMPVITDERRPMGIVPDMATSRMPSGAELTVSGRPGMAAFRVNGALGRGMEMPAPQMDPLHKEMQRSEVKPAATSLGNSSMEAEAAPAEKSLGSSPMEAEAAPAEKQVKEGTGATAGDVRTAASDSVEDEVDEALDDIRNPAELADALASGELSPEAQAELIHQVVEGGVDSMGSLLGVRTLENVDLTFDPGSYDTLVLSPAQRQAVADALITAHNEQPFSEEELLSLAPYLPDLARSTTGSVDGGLVESIGEALEERGDEGDAALAAFAFTSSAALIAEHYPTNADRVEAFELLNDALPDAYGGLIGDYATDGQERVAANLTRLFAFDTEGLLEHYLATGHDEESTLATFFSNTLLNPAFANVPIEEGLDGKGTESISELLNRRIDEYSGAIFDRLGETTDANEAERANLSDKLGRLAASVLGGATILLEEGEAERETLANLVTSTLGALIPSFTGSDVLISALGDTIRNSEIDGADAAEQFAEQLSNSFQTVLEELESTLNTGVLTSAFVSAFDHEKGWLTEERN